MKLDYDRGTHEIRLLSYLWDPNQVTDLEKLREYDNDAQKTIERLQAIIQRVNNYREDLQERAAYLIATPAELKIELKREHRYFYGEHDRIFYFLTIYRTYPDGTKTVIENHKYPGKERHKAIADYKAACKAHPGAPHTMDIEKGRWEK